MTARTRVDGWAKVTGAARYAADHRLDNLAHAVLVTSTVPAGRIAELDVTEAERAPGALAVITHRNAPRLSPAGDFYVQTVLPLQDDLIRYEGEPVAVVVADRLERAGEAAALVRVTYETAPATVELDDALPDAYRLGAYFEPITSSVGDVAAGLERADVVVERTYTTAARHHSTMEPSATLAEWRDGMLTLYDATQGVFNVRDAVCAALDLPADRVRVIAEYVGGGFGCKGFVWPHQLIAPMAARTVGGAVKLVLTRAQTFTSHGYQPPTRQTVTLGAARDGRLTAIRHTSVNSTSTYADHLEMAAICSRAMYACPAIETDHLLAPVSTVLPTPMRAPSDGPGMVALESAMDELAYELDIDPVELRLRNYAERDPTKGRPFSSKALRACYAEGARRFGWADRPMRPGALRDGNDLVGWGMASATMATFAAPASARVSIDADGRVLVEAGSQEIGTGTRTVLCQLAAEALGCPPERVTIRLGDTTLPPTGMTAGSSTTMSVGSAVQLAARSLRTKLASMALAEGDAPAELARLDGDALVVEGAPRTPLRELIGDDPVGAEASWSPSTADVSMHTFGAVFAEVRIDADLCLPRVSRLVGVYSAGRIVNPLTARSQMIGGMTWGIGQALLERSPVDRRLGRFVNKNLAGYLVPVNADVPELDASFVDEHDEHAGTVGGRGIGELGAVGVGPAIANAVFHATGTRIRGLPIAPETLLRGDGDGRD
ncbi:MAG: molybdopterin-dependent oxidoreductase [Streptosporangiales bacterium]|nr:molybdopterin-dependent oxidoreductase [Streptosporangiales bacterium]